jgi:hypothetical protein
MKRALATSIAVVSSVLALAVVAITASGCGASPPPTTARRGPLTARDLYPFGDGYIWTYDVDTQTGINSLGIRRVIRATPPRFVLQNDAERDEHTYEVREGGIYDVGDDLWVLRDPIRVGTEWPSRGGRTARITEVAQDVDTPAGRFSDCIEVRETGSPTGPDFLTVYCSDQGPVIIESHQALQTSSSGITIRAVLRMPLQRGMEDVEQPEGYEGP